MYKIVNSLCLEGKLVPKSQLSNYTTRNQLDLDIPWVNPEFSKNNFFHSGIKT